MDEEKHQIDKDGRLFYARTFTLLSLVVLGYLVYLIARPFLAPFAWAAIISFLLYPLQVKLTGRLSGRPALSSLILTLATIFFLVGPLTVLAAAFAAQAAELLNAAQASGNSPGAIISRLQQTPIIGDLLKDIRVRFDIAPSEIQAWLTDIARNVLQFMVSISGRLFLGAVSTITAFSIMLFILFFLLKDGARIIDYLKSLIPMTANRTETLFSQMASVMRAVVFGTVLTAIVQGALVGVAFAALGLSAPVVFGALAALCALLPIGGPAIIWAPAVVFLAIDDRWLSAIGLSLWGIVLVATIDNLLRPIIVSSRGHVGTLTVFIGVLGGAIAFGMVGLLLGPVVLALCFALLQFMRELRRGDDLSKDLGG